MDAKQKSEEKDNIKGTTVSVFLQTFALHSTIHGLNKIVLTKMLLWKIFWILIFCGASVAFAGQLATLLQKYISNPTKTTVEVTREHTEFPDVTVCPLRNFDMSVLYSLYNQLNISRSPSGSLLLNVTRAVPEFEMAYNRKLGQYFRLWQKYYYTNASLFGMAMTRSNMFANFDLDVLEKGMIPPWELMVRCRWQGEKCTENMISTFKDPYFFQCVTIHAPEGAVLSEGVESGLAIVGIFGSNMVDWSEFHATLQTPLLVAGIQEFNHPLAGDQGARVVIHPHGSKPIPSAEGYNVPPGFSGSLGVNIQRTLNLEEPYGKCSKVDRGSPGNETYRLLPCLRRCISEEVVKECKCIDTLLPESSRLYMEEYNYTFCGHVEDLSDDCVNAADSPTFCLQNLADAVSRMLCARRVQNEMEKRRNLMDVCQCFTPCDDIKYTVQYSLSEWPPGPEMDSIYLEIVTEDQFFQNFMKTQPNSIKLDMYMKHFSFENRFKGLKDMAKINVYVADTSIIKTSQHVDYTTGDLLSDLGGIMGLWIGMSVLSVAELLQLVFDLCKLLNGRTERRQKRTLIQPVTQLKK